MEFLFIFAAGWLISHAFGEKRDEYEHAQDAHREKYMRRLADKHPHWSKARQARYLQNAARRNALGHLAYLLRHGWSSTFADFVHGWDKAKASHEEWKAEHPKDGKKPSLWATFKAGIQKERATRYVDAAKTDAPTPVQASVEPATSAPIPTPAPALDDEPETDPWLTDDEARDAQIYPWPAGKPAPADTIPGDTAGSTNGVPVTTTITAGEASSIEDVRQNSAAFANTLQQVHAAADQLLADVLRFASKDAETKARIERGMEALNNAIAEFGGMPTSLQKHIAGEEYAQQAHSVDDINALRTS